LPAWRRSNKIDERLWFLLCSLGFGAATAGAFIAIGIHSPTFIYEDVIPVLWLEILMTVGYTLWAFRMLNKGSKE
jgi:hypothetical protein